MQGQDIRKLLADAITRHQSGRIDDAAAIYRQILAIAPDHVDSLQLSGVIASQKGDHQAAVKLIGRAITLKGDAPQFHNNIAAAYRALGRLDDAARHYREAVALKPDYAEAHSNLGAVLQDQGQTDDAEKCFTRAVHLKPDYAKAHMGLGVALQSRGRLDEAEARYRAALGLNPDFAEAHNNLGINFQMRRNWAESEAHHQRAIALKPDYAKAHYNLAVACEEQGKLEDALRHYDRAQALDPNDVDAHWNESLILLLRGEYARGWQQYEWRLRRAKSPPLNAERPLWNGGDLTGRTILLQAEQGYGDTIQFVRYAPLVKQRGGRVVLQCPPGLARLMATASGVDQVASWNEQAPATDCRAALLSLPALLGTTMENIPATVPYLQARADLTEAWRRKMPATGLKVGLVWRGNPDNSINHKKSIPPEFLGPLLGVPGVRWFSLQADATPEEVAVLSAHGAIENCGPALADWADTAALISALDLVVSVDTGVAHLAGALGKTGWVPLSFIPDWRWLLERADSPWYPTLRLFRQAAFGAWPGVIARMRDDLTALARR